MMELKADFSRNIACWKTISMWYLVSRVIIWCCDYLSRNMHINISFVDNYWLMNNFYYIAALTVLTDRFWLGVVGLSFILIMFLANIISFLFICRNRESFYLIPICSLILDLISTFIILVLFPRYNNEYPIVGVLYKFIGILILLKSMSCVKQRKINSQI